MFFCAAPGCKKRTRRPAQNGWKGGLYNLDTTFPGDHPRELNMWLEFCPKHCDRRV